jgi:hypothetical protein
MHDIRVVLTTRRKLYFFCRIKRNTKVCFSNSRRKVPWSTGRGADCLFPKSLAAQIKQILAVWDNSTFSRDATD